MPATRPTPSSNPEPATVTGRRWLGLPAIARLARFARHPGPAVLLTTADRAAAFRDAGVFGALTSVDPGLSATGTSATTKVVCTVEHALRAFPTTRRRYALVLRVGARSGATTCSTGCSATATSATRRPASASGRHRRAAH
jgi:hypothetical protein